MQWNAERRDFRPAAKLLHIQWTLVIDGNNVLPQIDRLANCVNEVAAEPAMLDKRPAAQIDCVNVRFQLSELCTYNVGSLITDDRQSSYIMTVDRQNIIPIVYHFV